MKEFKYFKVLKSEHVIGLIVGEELKNKNIKILSQVIIMNLPIKCIFYKKTPIDRNEFEHLMKILNLGCCPESAIPTLSGEF